MLLRSLRAVNFLRYREITIPEIPTHGVVGIETTEGADPGIVRDLLLFALFGRTSDGRWAPKDVIRPGAGYSYVEVAFAHPKAGPISMFRGLDQKGTIQVSLREISLNRVFNRESEARARLEELIGGAPEPLLRKHFPDLAAVAPALPVAGEAPDPAEIEELTRERNRIQGRLRRARRQVRKLEATGEIDAADAAKRLREELAPAGDAAAAAPVDRGAVLGAAATVGRALRREASLGSLAEKVRELEGVARRLKADRRRTNQFLLKKENEKRETLDRLRRVNEYREKLDELKTRVLAAGMGMEPGGAGAVGLGALGTEIRRADRGRNAARSARLALAMGAVAIVLMLALLLLNTRAGGQAEYLPVLNGALGLLVIFDLWFALRCWKAWDEAREAAPAPRKDLFDPQPLLAEIETGYADVAADLEKEPELAARLKERLQGIDREVAAPGARQQRLDDLLRTLEVEWKRAKRECPELPEGPEESGAGESPLDDGELAGMGERLNRMVDGILRLSVRSADAAAASPPPAPEALATLKAGVGELLAAAGDSRTADAFLAAAGLEDARGAAGDPDPRSQERRFADFERRIREEIERIELPKAGAAAAVDPDAEARLAELEPTVEVVEQVLGRQDAAERELEDVQRRLTAARAAVAGARDAALSAAGREVPAGLEKLFSAEGLTGIRSADGGGFLVLSADGSETGVPRDSDLGTRILLAAALRVARGERADVSEGSQFVLVDAAALPGAVPAAADLMALVERCAPEVSQVVFIGDGPRLPAGAGVSLSIKGGAAQ